MPAQTSLRSFQATFCEVEKDLKKADALRNRGVLALTVGAGLAVIGGAVVALPALPAVVGTVAIGETVGVFGTAATALGGAAGLGGVCLSAKG